MLVVLFPGSSPVCIRLIAKGSSGGRVLFMFMASFWFIITQNGLTTILKKNVQAHKIWMMRSYAMAMTAVTFRVYHIVFYLLGWVAREIKL